MAIQRQPVKRTYGAVETIPIIDPRRAARA